MLAAFSLSTLVRPTGAAEGAPNEYDVKAVDLITFAAYVTWPADALPTADTPVTIGILGEDPFGAKLEQNAPKVATRLLKRKVVIKRSGKLDDLKNCNILFVGKSERDRVPQILGALTSARVLTVGETEGFAARGGIVNFYIAPDDTVRFEINNNAAVRHGLKISPQLLKLGKIIE